MFSSTYVLANLLHSFQVETPTLFKSTPEVRLRDFRLKLVFI